MGTRAPRKKKSRIPRPKLLDPEDERQRLRVTFVTAYAGDEGFQQALVALAEATNPDGAALCKKWGLTFAGDEAETAIEAWCEGYNAGECLEVAELPSYFHWGGLKPRNHGDIKFRFIWDPTGQARSDIEARLRSKFELQMKTALDEIGEASGACFEERPRKGRNEERRHMNWLFQRQRHGLSYKAIAAADPMIGTDAVRKACRRLAARMGLKLIET